jgi:hypothetical protein
MGLLTRGDLLKKETLSKEKVELNENGDFVYVRQMTAHEKNVWEMSQMKKTVDAKRKVQYDLSLEDYRAKLAVCCVCDEEGNLLFAPEDYHELSANISAATLEKIVDVAQKLNAITEEDKEEMVKN